MESNDHSAVSPQIKKETKKNLDVSIEDEDEYEDIIDINDPSFNLPTPPTTTVITNETKPIIIKREPNKDPTTTNPVINVANISTEVIEYDQAAFDKLNNLLTHFMNRDKVSELKSFLIEKSTRPLAYFHKNEFIKEVFMSIYNFMFQNTELSREFSSFFAFKDVLCYIKNTNIYKQAFEIYDDELDLKIHMLTKVLYDIIDKQKKEKKKIKNRKVYLKRKEKEKEKLRKKEQEKEHNEDNTNNNNQLHINSNSNNNISIREDNDDLLTIEEQIAVGLIQCDEQD
jgi:hypothetical protein